MCAIETAKEFIAAGTAPDFLYGLCEGMWQPDMVRDCRSSKASPTAHLANVHLHDRGLCMVLICRAGPVSGTQMSCRLFQGISGTYLVAGAGGVPVCEGGIWQWRISPAGFLRSLWCDYAGTRAAL